jgi:hypothetical protein
MILLFPGCAKHGKHGRDPTGRRRRRRMSTQCQGMTVQGNFVFSTVKWREIM